LSIPSNSRTTASVIIVNWNGRHWLEQCLPALAAQSFRDFEVIVVDNGSSDGSREWLAEHWPDVRLLPQAANTGFAAGNNAGIRMAQGRYVVTLNNDTRPEGEWLAALVAAAHSPAVGMVASKIVQWQRPDRLDSTGIEVDWLGVAWNRGWGERADTVAPLAVFGPSASAALYRRDMLDGIGLFDDRFFAFYEDVDLAWRAQRAGWRCRFAAEALVHHWHSASTAAIPEQKLFLLGRNRLWCTLKNYPLTGLLRALPLLVLYELAATSYQMGRSRSWAPLRGRWAGLKGARRFWRQRDRCYADPVPLSPLRLRRLASLSG
jgi:GT2 family glycosyltransferase